MRASNVFVDSKYHHAEIKESMVVCPVCGFDYQHEGEPKTIKSNDGYAAGWWGRGDLTVFPFWGECGTSWELCFGFHKGNIYAFTKITELGCKKNDGEEDDKK